MTDIPNIMSIRELIDAAFGNSRMNVVNHKLIQTILVILAKQLRLLERRVEVEIGPTLDVISGTSLTVTEVKIQANVPRNQKVKGFTTGGYVTTKSQKVTKSKTRMHERTLTFDDKTLSSETTTSDKISIGKSSLELASYTAKSTTDKSGSDEINSSKTSSDETRSDKRSSDEISNKQILSDKSKTDTTKSSPEETSAHMTTIKQYSANDTTPTEKYIKPTAELTSTNKTSNGKSSSSLDKQPLPQDYQKLLDKIETQRERELRIIRQRTNSREVRNKTPTPMASMDSLEKQYEKLLIVERVSTDGTKTASHSNTDLHGKKTPRLSIVTEDEFEKLAAVVHQLQETFQTTGVPDSPEDVQLLNDLRKKASLTDAMAALQLSVRMEAAEKVLEKLTTFVTDFMRKTSEINTKEFSETTQELGKDGTKDQTDLSFELNGSQPSPDFKRPFTIKKDASHIPRQSMSPQSTHEESTALSTITNILPETQVDSEPAQVALAAEESAEKPQKLTYEEVENALQELHKECFKMVTTLTNSCNVNANNALKIAHKLDGKLDESLKLRDRMFAIENSIYKYADEMDIFDAGLSSQMTTYQEQLTQMQNDLESGLQTMKETLAHKGSESAAIAELNNHLRIFQTDIDDISSSQKELKDFQDTLLMNLQALKKQIEILKDTKSDREEVTNAFKDKAGLGDLNEMVSREEFDAVRGDFEKRISAAYKTFNDEELVWQKAIDDLIKDLLEKADWLQVVTLRGSIQQYLEKLTAKIREMEEIVGEPRAAKLSRQLHRDAECLCCATPAHMNVEEPGTVPLMPTFPRPTAAGAETKSEPKEDGDHRGFCYPGLPVPHTVNQSAHACHRYCGGSHTLINKTLGRAPASMIIHPALRQVSTTIGTDGKLYMVEEDIVKEPCIPCNAKIVQTPETLEAEPASSQRQSTTPNMTSFDFREPSIEASNTFSVTPPLPIDDV